LQNIVNHKKTASYELSCCRTMP